MKNVLWKGISYDSLEYLKLTNRQHERIIESKIIGCSNGQFWYINYQLSTQIDWVVKNFTITMELNDQMNLIEGKNVNGNWKINGQDKVGIGNIGFIDISLTPSTNSLVVNNLILNGEAELEVDVLYLDLLKNEIYPVKQKYTCISSENFLYENLSSGFKASILVDTAGFVLDYPNLFKRINL